MVRAFSLLRRCKQQLHQDTKRKNGTEDAMKTKTNIKAGSLKIMAMTPKMVKVSPVGHLEPLPDQP